jgi:hypothetical protein
MSLTRAPRWPVARLPYILSTNVPSQVVAKAGPRGDDDLCLTWFARTILETL